MTVSATENRKEHAGNGTTTSFATPVFFNESEVLVYLVNDTTGASTQWTLNTQFTLTGEGNASGGTLTVETAPTDYTPASGETLVIITDPTIDQGVDLVNNDALDAEVLEQALDELTVMIQRVNSKQERGFKFSDDAVGVDGVSTDIPAPEADKVLRWNNDADALENINAEDFGTATVSDFARTLIDDADADSALSTLGFSAYGKTLIDDADAAAAQITLSAKGVISTLANLKAETNITNGRTIFLTDGDRGGEFVFDNSNLSTEVTNDPSNGIYVPPDSDTSGASGAWVRNHQKGFYHARWWGPVGDGSTDDQPALQDACDYCESTGGGVVWLGVPDTSWRLDSSLELRGGTVLAGAGRDTLVTGDSAAASTYSSIILYEDNCGLRDMLIRGSSDVDDSKGFTHVWIKDEGASSAPGDGPFNVVIDNVHIEKTSNQGFAFVGTTKCRLLNSSVKDGKGHGFVFSNDTDSVASVINIEGQVEKTGGGSGKYGFDISNGCVNTTAVDVVIRNCEQGFKIEDASGDRDEDGNTARNIHIIGGANSTERAITIDGKNSYVQNVIMDGLVPTDDRCVDITANSTGTVIDGIKILNVTTSVGQGISLAADYATLSNVEIDSSGVATGIRVNQANGVKIKGYKERNVTTTSLKTETDGVNAITDLTLEDFDVTDEVVIDDDGASVGCERLRMSRIYTSGGGVSLQNVTDAVLVDVHAVKQGSRPINMSGPTDVKLIGCTSDNVDQTSQAFFVSGGTPTRLSIIGCTARNGSEGFTNNGLTPVDCIISSCISQNNTSDQSGWGTGGTDTFFSGNTF